MRGWKWNDWGRLLDHWSVSSYIVPSTHPTLMKYHTAPNIIQAITHIHYLWLEWIDSSTPYMLSSQAIVICRALLPERQTVHQGRGDAGCEAACHKPAWWWITSFDSSLPYIEPSSINADLYQCLVVVMASTQQSGTETVSRASWSCRGISKTVIHPDEEMNADTAFLHLQLLPADAAIRMVQINSYLSSTQPSVHLIINQEEEGLGAKANFNTYQFKPTAVGHCKLWLKLKAQFGVIFFSCLHLILLLMS